MDVFLVGGAVRDMVLGLPNEDQDFVVVGATPEQMMALGYVPVEATSFPIFFDEFGREYALARTEKKTGKGYHGFEANFNPSVSLKEDLRRRDLTMNAMAIRIEQFNPDGSFVLDTLSEGDDYFDFEGLKVYDPFGGYADVSSKMVRHVSEAFMEDPVRVLRAARFAAKYDFSIDRNTHQLMVDIGNSGELDYLTPERVWLEVSKAAKTGKLWQFLVSLQSCGAIKHVMPEIGDRLYEFRSLDTYKFEDLTADQAIGVLFGMITKPEEVYNLMNIKLRAPATITSLVKAVNLVVNSSFGGSGSVTAECMLELMYKLDLFRHPTRVVDIVAMLRVFQFPSQYEEMGSLLQPCFDMVHSVGFDSLPLIDQNQLRGPEIGEAVKQKRLDVLTNFLGN